MRVFSKTTQLKNELLNKTGFTLGFVPTMGALHEGHLSLVNQSLRENDITVVSIFVNPKQFNDQKDLQKYPRDLQLDLQLLEKCGCDIVYTPEVHEVYPDKNEEHFSFGHIENVMEGEHRPGHFNGVAQVVSRLFRIVNPHKAYFGLKDFQQVAIIKKLVQILDFNIEIIACPILREDDGLAMSSRNVLLGNQERKNASLISQTLFKSQEYAKSHSVSETKSWVISTINKNQYLNVEYFDIVNDIELTSINVWTDNIVGCIAVIAGNIRLIDNISFF